MVAALLCSVASGLKPDATEQSGGQPGADPAPKQTINIQPLSSPIYRNPQSGVYVQKTNNAARACGFDEPSPPVLR